NRFCLDRTRHDAPSPRAILIYGVCAYTEVDGETTESLRGQIRGASYALNQNERIWHDSTPGMDANSPGRRNHRRPGHGATMSALGMELLTEEGERPRTGMHPVPGEVVETGEFAVDDFLSGLAQRLLERARDLDSKRGIGLSL